MRIPTVISSKNAPTVSIFDKCSEEAWKAAEGATGNDAEIVLDYGCPIKLQEVHLLNGDGDFRTKSFSVLGSQSTDGPWKSIITGEMGTDMDEV